MIEVVKQRIADYQASLEPWYQVDLKFHNKWNQPYSIRTYKKGAKYYLSISAATSCICEPGLQLNFQKTSWLDNQRRTWKGTTIGTGTHLLADGTAQSPEHALALALNKNPYFQETDGWFEKTIPEILAGITKAFEEYKVLWKKSGFVSVGKEITFFNDDIMVAGTIDDLVCSQTTNKFGIVDLKTGNQTNGVAIESKMSGYKFLVEPIVLEKLFFTIFDLPKDPEDTNGHFFTYNHYDLNLDSFLGALTLFKVAEWKQLKTFWPGWDVRIKNLLELNHFKVEQFHSEVTASNVRILGGAV